MLFARAKKGELIHIPHNVCEDVMYEKLVYSICNANLDGRDIVAIMPTGVYALPPFHVFAKYSQAVENLWDTSFLR